MVSYTGKKLSIFLMWKTVFNHKHDIMYYANRADESFPHDYED